MKLRINTPKISVLLVALMLAIAIVGCSNWEQATFQTLYSGKALVDQAASDYNSGVIPQTSVNRDVIEKARYVHNTAVQAFESYWKVAHPCDFIQDPAAKKDCLSVPADKGTIEALRQKAIVALSELPAILARIGEIYHPKS